MLAVVWHYWIAIFLIIPVILLCLFTVLGYLVKVVGPRYPRR